MAGGGTTCASCIRFDLEKAAKDQCHRAQCPEFKDMRRWDNPACPLHAEDRRRDARRALVAAIKESEKETMTKFETKAGDVWITALKLQVKITDRSIPDVIQAEYLELPPSGLKVINFDITTGCSIQGGDCLVERVEG